MKNLSPKQSAHKLFSESCATAVSVFRLIFFASLQFLSLPLRNCLWKSNHRCLEVHCCTEKHAQENDAPQQRGVTPHPSERKWERTFWFSFLSFEMRHRWLIDTYSSGTTPLIMYTLPRVSLCYESLWESRREVNHIKCEVLRLGARRPERFPSVCDSAWSRCYRCVSLSVSLLSVIKLSDSLPVPHTEH